MLTHGLSQLLAGGPVVMGIVNVTPDSFSDGGRCLRPCEAFQQALRFVEEGATILDVGGESSRPGAQPVSLQEELDRVVPVIEQIHRELPHTCISIDTYKPEVMEAAFKAGAGMINDIYALRQPGALAMAARLGVPVCLMHMQGVPQTMQRSPNYVIEGDVQVAAPVIDIVVSFLSERIESCVNAGIAREQLSVDPGFGFGKTLSHNLALLRSLNAFSMLDCPILVGVSRKSMIGELLNRPIHDRLAGGLAMGCYALSQGASIIRTHDVAQTVDVLRTWRALSNEL